MKLEIKHTEHGGIFQQVYDVKNLEDCTDRVIIITSDYRVKSMQKKNIIELKLKE